VAPSHAVIVAVQRYATAAIHTALAAAFDDTFMVATGSNRRTCVIGDLLLADRGRARSGSPTSH
jgi:hypothetical protein